MEIFMDNTFMDSTKMTQRLIEELLTLYMKEMDNMPGWSFCIDGKTRITISAEKEGKDAKI